MGGFCGRPHSLGNSISIRVADNHKCRPSICTNLLSFVQY